MEINEIPVSLSIPGEGLGIVAMQPHLQIGTTEPFQWQSSAKQEQIDRIRATLELSCLAPHEAGKTHFTLLPEYAIPGIDGFDIVQRCMEESSWPQGTVVIGGIDGLTKDQYKTLCERERVHTHVKNSPKGVGDGQWVNCCSTWIKTNEGQNPIVEAWIQPKLRPSLLEGVTTLCMFEGKAINVFECTLEGNGVFRFLSLICFDWIASLGTITVVATILQMLKAGSQVKPLHLAVILQKNRKPNDNYFLMNTHRFFTDQANKDIVRDCVVIFANVAGNESPGQCKEHGYSGLVFAPHLPCTYKDGVSPASYAIHTGLLRNNTILRPCKEALFRENGACIHAFRLFHPVHLVGASGEPRMPIRPALVYSLDTAANDPRTPGRQVAAVVKRVNDWLDSIPQFVEEDTSLFGALNGSQNKIVASVRCLGEQQLLKAMWLGTAPSTLESVKDVDGWTDVQKQSLENVVLSLTVLDCVGEVAVGVYDTHALLVLSEDVLDVVVVTGKTHLSNRQSVMERYHGRQQTRTLIISHAQSPIPITDKDKPVWDADNDTKCVALQDLTNCMAATDVTTLCDRVKALIEG